MKHTVFLSYSRKDRIKVEQIVLLFHQFNIDVKQDIKDMRPPDNIPNAIDKMIKEVGIVFVALSENSINSLWVQKEVSIAHQRIKDGAPIQLIYILIDKNIVKPDYMGDDLYIDLSESSFSKNAIIDVAKIFIQSPPSRQFGIFQTYSNRDELNRWRLSADGTVGCTLDQFIEEAETNIVAVGLWFGALFGEDQGNKLAECLAKNSSLKIDLYAPDLQIASKQQLIRAHTNSEGMVHCISNFIKVFRRWRASRSLKKSDSERIKLHLMPFIPTCSYLCVDPEWPRGRMIVDLYAPGIVPSTQLKLELRGPNTPAYTAYLKSLQFIAMTSKKTIETSFK